VIVRADAPTGVQAAQAVHAAGRSAQLPEARRTDPPTTAVVLAASLDELCALARALTHGAVPHVFVREPDDPWRNAPMAIGIAPMSRARVRRHVAHLPLVRGKDGHG
jgi:hypothetical protein